MVSILRLQCSPTSNSKYKGPSGLRLPNLKRWGPGVTDRAAGSVPRTLFPSISTSASPSCMRKQSYNSHQILPYTPTPGAHTLIAHLDSLGTRRCRDIFAFSNFFGTLIAHLDLLGTRRCRDLCGSAHFHDKQLPEHVGFDHNSIQRTRQSPRLYQWECVSCAAEGALSTCTRRQQRCRTSPTNHLRGSNLTASTLPEACEFACIFQIRGGSRSKTMHRLKCTCVSRQKSTIDSGVLGTVKHF